MLPSVQRHVCQIKGIGVRNMHSPVSHDLNSLPSTICEVAVPNDASQNYAEQKAALRALIEATKSLYERSERERHEPAPQKFYQKLLSPSTKPAPLVLSPPPSEFSKLILDILRIFSNSFQADSDYSKQLRLLLYKCGWRGMSLDKLESNKPKKQNKEVNYIINSNNNENQNYSYWENNSVKIENLKIGLEKIVQLIELSSANQNNSFDKIYRSHIQQFTTNPFWTCVGNFESMTFSRPQKEIEISVYQIGNEKKLLFQEIINLQTLRFICPLISQTPQLPQDTLIIQLNDGIYTLPNVNLKLNSPVIAKPTTNNEKNTQIDLVDAIKNALQLRSMSDHTFDVKAQLRLSHDVTCERSSLVLDRMHLIRKLKYLRLRRDWTKEELQRFRATIEFEEKELETRRQNLIIRAKTLKSVQMKLLERRQNFIDHEQRFLDHDIQTQEKVRSLLWKRQWRMVSCLRVIYPIEEDSSQLSPTLTTMKSPILSLPPITSSNETNDDNNNNNNNQQSTRSRSQSSPRNTPTSNSSTSTQFISPRPLNSSASSRQLKPYNASTATGSSSGSNNFSNFIGIYSIRRSFLPNINTFKSMENISNELHTQLSAATGYVCHILILLSKYFQIPLQHPIKFLGSRSSISTNRLRDSLEFPLYERGVDRILFGLGLYLLNTDLEQLAQCLGFEVDTNDAEILKNLLIVLYGVNNRLTRISAQPEQQRVSGQ